MSKTKSLSLGLSAVALMAAGPALADITADELWSIWQDQASEFGYTLSAEAAPSGNGLVLTNVTNTMMIEEVAITGTIAQITLANQDDGTVAISVADTLTYRISGFDDSDAPDSIDILFSLTGFTGTASGSAQNLDVVSGFDRIAVERVDFVGGDPSEMPEITHDIALTGYSASASYDLTDPSRIGISSSASLAGLTINAEIFEPAGGGAPAPTPQPQPQQPTYPAPGKIVLPEAQPAPAPQPTGGGRGDGHLGLAVSMADLQANSSGTMPRGIDWMTIETFPEGFAIEGDASYGSASATFDFLDGRDMIDFAASNTGGSVGFGMSAEHLRYALSATGVELSLASNEMPFPVAASAESTGLAIEIPLAQEAEPSPFSAALAYRGVSVDDGLWAVIDPGQAVPRTPATVVLDLSGTVQLFVDLMTMDPEQMMSGPPGELRDLTINELQVSFGGAELTGSGDMDFAPGQMMPMPVGAVDLRLTGANGLIQSMANGGLLPPEQAGMARGMLGMFALPGDAPDSYTSTIEFLPGGGITANGVPLQ